MSHSLRTHPRLPHVVGALGALMIAFSAIFVKLADVAPSTAAVFRCVYALPPLALLAAWERRRYGPRSAHARRLAFGAGAFFAADLTLWHHSITYVGAGLSTVLANAQVVVVGVVAWLLLRERPSGRIVVAIPVVLAGGVLISGVVGQGAYGKDPVLGSTLALLTAFSYSGFILLLRQGNRPERDPDSGETRGGVTRPAGPLLDASIAAIVVAGLAGALVGDLSLTPTWPAHGWLLALALNSQVLGWLLISVTLPRLPAVVTSVLLMLQPAGSVLLGMALLDEAPSGVQLAGVVVVLAGVALASMPRRKPHASASASASSSVPPG